MFETKLKEKIQGLIIFLIFYLIAYVIGFAAVINVNNVALKLFLFDIIATIVIYLLSLTIKNSSLYDAYWSLTPFVMITYLLIRNINDLNIYHYLTYIVFSLWSIRLTVNWIITFENIKWVDWRYKQLQESNNPFVWQIINLFGIMMMPTILVFAGFYPLIVVFNNSINYLSIIGIAIIFVGTCLEFFADHQMHEFLRGDNKGKVIQIGLWKYSRHPNYLGEILIWVGVYFVLFPSLIDYWYLFFGAVLIILLFNFISIPLAEKRQLKRRKDYLNYKKRTSRLLILPLKKLLDEKDN